MDPATLSLIVSLALKGVSMGYNYYQSTQYALKQASIKKSMLEADQAQLALAMHDNFPNVTFDEWLSIVKDAQPSQIPDHSGITNNSWTKYAPIVGVGILFLLVSLRDQ